MNGTGMKPFKGMHLVIPYKYAVHVGDSGAYGTLELMSETYTDSQGHFELFYYDRIRRDYTSSVVIVSDSFDRYLDYRKVGMDVNDFTIYLSDSATYAIYGDPDLLKNGDKLVISFGTDLDTTTYTVMKPKPGFILSKRFHARHTPSFITMILYNKSVEYYARGYQDWYFSHLVDPDTNRLTFSTGY